MQPATQLVTRRHPGEQAGLQQRVVDQAIGVSALRQPGRIAPQFDVARLLARSIAVVPPLQETQLDHPNLQVTPEIRGLDGFDPLQSGSRCVHAARERPPGIDILYYRLIGDVDDRAIDPATLDQVALQVFQEILERHLRGIAARRDDGGTRRRLERVGPCPRLRATSDMHQLDIAQARGQAELDPPIEPAIIERVRAVGCAADANQLEIGLEHRLPVGAHILGIRAEQPPVLLAPLFYVMLLGDGPSAEPVRYPEGRELGQGDRQHVDRQADGREQLGPGSQRHGAAVDAGLGLARNRHPHQRGLARPRAQRDALVIEQRVGEVVRCTAHQLAVGSVVGVAAQPHISDPIGADGARRKPAPTGPDQEGWFDANRVEAGFSRPQHDLRGLGFTAGRDESHGRGGALRFRRIAKHVLERGRGPDVNPVLRQRRHRLDDREQQQRGRRAHPPCFSYTRT